jgi:hypothetical protein
MNETNDPKPQPTGRRKLSAFALATESVSVNAQIDVEDVLHLCPAWTPQQAAEFLREHGNVIGPAMVRRGAEVLASMLPRGQHD